MLTQPMLQSLWPGCPADLQAGIAAAAPTVFPANGLTTDLLIAHAFGQFSVECGKGTSLVENLNYTAAALVKTWPLHFTALTAPGFVGNPRAIANQAYNGRMGNAPGSDDGWNFRGRGAIQVTGRDGYAQLGTKLNLPLLDQPDLVNTPENFLHCAVIRFIECGALTPAQNNDVVGVTRAINNGLTGLPARITAFAQWTDALGVFARNTAWVQQSLNTIGTAKPLATDGVYGPGTVAAVQAFQTTHGLHPTGTISAETIAALTAALT